MGRQAGGVTAIRLQDDDEIAGVGVIPVDNQEADLIVITEQGFGKRTNLSEFRQQLRPGLGVRAMGLDLERTGYVAGAMVVDRDEDDITAITVNGITLRTSVESINRYGRAAMGVRVMNIDDDDAIVSVTIVENREDEDVLTSNGNGTGESETVAEIEVPDLDEIDRV